MEKTPPTLPPTAASKSGVPQEAREAAAEAEVSRGGASEDSNSSPDDADDLNFAKLSQGAPEPDPSQSAAPDSSPPAFDASGEPDVPVEEAIGGLDPTPDAAITEAVSDNSNPALVDPATYARLNSIFDGVPQPAEDAAADSTLNEKGPHPDPEDSSDSIHAGHYDTRLLNPSSIDELAERLGFEATSSRARPPEPEAAPEPASENVIEEIERGEDNKGDVYFLFVLSKGKILLPAEKLNSNLSVLVQALLKKGYMVDAQDKREIWQRLRRTPPDIRFNVVYKTGWYNRAYVTPTKVYGKYSLPIFLYPER
jgi:hypothetical protein